MTRTSLNLALKYQRIPRAAQPSLFDGATIDPQLDAARLETLLGKVSELMYDGAWRTLAEIRDVTGGSEAGISARLRDLRKRKFGGHLVERRRRGDPKAGLFQYRLIWRG